MTTHQHPPLTPFGSALAGALGSVFANAVVYPLDTVKTRLQALDEEEFEISNDSESNDVEQVSLTEDEQATSVKDKNDGDAHDPVRRWKRSLRRRMRHWGMMTLLLRILKTEGLAGAFHGFGASMLGTFSQQFAYFFFHTFLRTNYINRLSTRSNAGVKGTAVHVQRASLSTGAELLLGALAGALAQIFTIPVNVIATRQQLWQPEPSQKGSAGAAPSLLETANEIIAENGITGLWTGLKPGLVLTVNPAITYGVFERLKSWKLKNRPAGSKLEVAEAFWLGVGSKTLATVVTYPYIFAKVRLQAKYVDDTPPAPSTTDSTPNHPSGSEAPSYASVASLPPPSFGDANTNASTISADPSSTSLTHPTPTAVTRPQINRKRSHHFHYHGAIALLKDIYKEKGLRGWYKGLGAQVLKAVLCQGITFVSKDQFESYAYLLIILFARLRKVN